MRTLEVVTSKKSNKKKAIFEISHLPGLNPEPFLVFQFLYNE